MYGVVPRRCVPTSDERLRLAIDDSFESFPKIWRLWLKAFLFAGVRIRNQGDEGIFSAVTDTHLESRRPFADSVSDTRCAGVAEYLSSICAGAPVVDVRDHAVKDRAPFG